MTVVAAADGSSSDATGRLVDLLRPWQATGSIDPADYAFLDGGALEHVVDRGPDTVLATAPLGRRRRMRHRLRSAGFIPISRVVLVPGWPATEHLLSVGPQFADGIERHLGASTSAAVLRWCAQRRWGRLIIVALAPNSGVVAKKDPDAAASGWLTVDGRPPAAVHVSRRPRGDAPTSVALLYWADTSSPFGVAKFARHPRGIQRLMHEREALSEVGASAPPCGIDVPALLQHGSDHIVMSVVAGSVATADLTSEQDSLTQFLHPALRALGVWQRTTASTVAIDDAVLAACVLDRLNIVGAACPDLRTYADAVAALARSIIGDDIALVSRHGDLTVANVLRTHDSIGFIDWESARPGALPSTDDWYLLLDAISIAHSCSHADALRLLLDRPAAPIRELVRRVDQLGASLDLGPAARDLAFHATWIEHASNEVERGSTSGRFVEVLRQLQGRAVDGQAVSISALAWADDGGDQPTNEPNPR